MNSSNNITENLCVTPRDEEANSGDEDEPKIITNIAMGMVALFSVCGILGNMLVIIVFSRKKHKLSSTFFILTLAVADFITSLITMPYTIVIELLEYHMQYDFLCKFYQFLKTTTVPFSAFIMVAIALDRYLCIVYPFKQVMSIKRAKISVFFLSSFAFILGIMCSLMIGTYQIYQEDSSHCTGLHLTHAINMTYGVSFNSTTIQKNEELYGNNNTNGMKPGDVYSLGQCLPSFLIFNPSFMKTYQKVYSSFFGVCAVLVVFLYALTYRSYRSVLTQRRKRFHSSEDNPQENTELTVLNEPDTSVAINENGRLKNKNQSIGGKVKSSELNSVANAHGQNGGTSDHDCHVRPSGVSRAKLKKQRVANIKTALMLSIVALIYIVAFTPAWLMALHVLPMNGIVYYFYFTYNVANPVIYAFLNQHFRTQLTALFKRRI